MVNRILIRIKVVQMLYAYLLTRTEFRIDTNPDLSSADKKFAYSAYIDLLMLLLLLTGHRVSPSGAPSTLHLDRRLTTSAVGKALASDLTLKELVFKNKHGECDISAVAPALLDEITSSAIYRENRNKRKFGLQEEVDMWIVLFESTIAKSATLRSAMRNVPGFTGVGFEMAVAKVVETLKSFYGAQAGYWQALQNLETSLMQSHKLYMSLFKLIVDLTRAAENRIENAKAKYLATAEEKNPNTRFIDNTLAAALADNEELSKAVKDYGIDWTADITLLNSLLNTITASKVYRDYIEAPAPDWNTDCEFWRSLMKDVILPSDDLAAALEDTSVYWNDDLHIIGTFVLKSLRIDAQNEPGHLQFLPHYKDEEDARFGSELFEFAVKNRDEYNDIINRFVDSANWDADRLAFMDDVIMICALAEIVNFPGVPLPVSLNEYIDIANMYSSAKSGQFINGIMSSAVQYLRREGIINK